MSFLGIHSAFVKVKAFTAFIHALVLVASVSVSEGSRPLEGLNLRCCTLVESPIVYVDPSAVHNQNFNGVAIDYLNLLEGTLGFHCETLKLFKANKPDHQGFTGFIYEMEGCSQNGTIIDSPQCQCDIGVGGWLLNEERNNRADFPRSFMKDDFRMLTHVDNINFHSASGAFFLTAFSTTTWFAIFGLLLFFVFLKLFDKKFVPADPQLLNPPLPTDASRYARIRHYLRNSRLPKRIKSATMNTLLEIVGQPTDDVQGDSQTTLQWCLTYVIILCGLFLILAYEATMAAALVQEAAQAEFRNIQDLKTCRVPAEEVCIPKGGAAFAFWNTTIAKSECNQKPGVSPPSIVDSYEEGHQKVASKQCKYFLASGATTEGAAQGRYCGEVATTGDSFYPADAIGTIDQFMRKKVKCMEKASVSLNFGRLKMFFVAAYAACVVIFILMVSFPRRRRKGQNRGEQNKTKGSVASSDDIESNLEVGNSEEEV